MIICPNCKKENADDAKFCLNCGYYFLESEQNTNSEKKDDDKKKKDKVKHKNKNKTKNKTKVKKEKTKGSRQKSSNDKPRSSIFTKILLLFFIILSIILLIATSILGYNYYLENNIEVPNVTGYSYEEATAILEASNLSYKLKEKETTDSSEVGIVIKQSKKAGSKTHENAVITLTVGVLDNHVTVPNVIGMTLEEAVSILNENNISYQIEYEETDDDENNTVIAQSIKANKTIENTEVLTITIAVNTSNEEEITTNDEDETDISTDEQENNET